TRDLDRPAGPRAVGEADSTQFDVVFRRHHDFGMRLDILFAAAKLSPSLGKNDFVILRLLERRLIGRGPELSACHVAEVTERAPVVASTVFAPACDGEILPTAIPT